MAVVFAGWLSSPAPAGILYWMVDGDASESLSYAYAQTLGQAGGKAEDVVVRLYSTDAAGAGREDYDVVGVETADLGATFSGAAVATEIPSYPARIYGLELGVIGEDGEITAYFTAGGESYESLVAMEVVQLGAVGGYGQAWNLASSVWTATTVPEPSGGILLLFGMAGLLLRRGRNG